MTHDQFRPGKTRLIVAAIVGLIVLTSVGFRQVIDCDFINYDDDLYVTDNSYVNRGLTSSGIIWAFTSVHASNWHPLTWLSHMLDCQLFGLNPQGHHLTNLLFHMANSILLFYVLMRMTGEQWKSLFAAALFAVHPLHVESVAWVAERKDVLSALWGLLTISAYASYAERPSTTRYLIVFSTLALGLMAKQMLVTLPFVLMLLDYWPLGRLDPGLTTINRGHIDGKPGLPQRSQLKSIWASVIEKIPLLILVTAFGFIVYSVQNNAGATQPLESLSINARVANALVSYSSYLWKIVWPKNLAVLYPHPGEDLSMGRIAWAAAVLSGITVWTLSAYKRIPYLFVGWLWYLGTLIPVIGLVPIGLLAMADRYTYIPSIGLFVIMSWGVPDLLRNLPYRRAIMGAGAATVVVCLTAATYYQVGYWRDSVSLFQHTVAVTERNFVAHMDLGAALQRQGRLKDALAQYARAVEVRPSSAAAHINMGTVLRGLGKDKAAIEEYHEALAIEPERVEAHLGLGMLLLRLKRPEEAAAHLAEVLRARPDLTGARFQLAGLLTSQGRFGEAGRHLMELTRVRPQNPEFHYALGVCLERQGKVDEASTEYLRTLRVDPRHSRASNRLGLILARQGRLKEAAARFAEALQTEPGFEDSRHNLSVVQERLRESDKLEKPASTDEEVSDRSQSDAHSP